MVKKDQVRTEIPYETKDGMADFHAAGRHTHITELLRNGASLPEARELARHSDVRITMRYAHIGLTDQAKALSRLGWECSGSESKVISGHLESPGDTKEVPDTNDASPVGDRACRELSADDADSQEWRRRESNPRPVVPQPKPLRV